MESKLFLPLESVRRKAQDSGRSMLNLSWSYLLQKRVLGLKDSLKHSGLFEQFTVFYFTHLCPWIMFHCLSKVTDSEQSMHGTFSLLLIHDKTWPLFAMVWLSHQEKYLAQKWQICKCPMAFAKFNNGFDRKRILTYFHILFIKLRDLPRKIEKIIIGKPTKTLWVWEVRKWRVMKGFIRWVALFMFKCALQNFDVFSWLENWWISIDP